MVSYVIAVDSVLKLFCARLLVREKIFVRDSQLAVSCWAWLPCYLPTCWCGIPQQSFSSGVLSWTKTPRSLLSLLLEIKCDSFIYGENSSAESPLRWRSSLLTGNVHMNFVEILLLTCHYLLSAWVKKSLTINCTCLRELAPLSFSRPCCQLTWCSTFDVDVWNSCWSY